MNAAEILAGIGRLRVLIAGDVCLDRWCRYDPALSEPSRETGIPRLAVVSTEVTAGAAGTVANNVAALGAARVDVLGLVGDDGFGYELERALDARGIGTGLLLRAAGASTFTYTKLLNGETGEEDRPRVDFINPRPPAPEWDRKLVAGLETAAPAYDAILVSDQAETAQGGVVTAAMREAIRRLAALNPQTLVWVDSRVRAEHFRGVIVKPNREEAEAASLRALGRVDFAGLRRHMEAPLLVVTHGGQGAELVDERGSRWAPAACIAHPVDICGAGDSFSAGAALALRVTGDAPAAAAFGNVVASITIMKKGTGTASPEEVLGQC
jgi:rfaE bifunctional protein kinase chain/domain